MSIDDWKPTVEGPMTEHDKALVCKAKKMNWEEIDALARQAETQEGHSALNDLVYREYKRDRARMETFYSHYDYDYERGGYEDD